MARWSNVAHRCRLRNGAYSSPAPQFEPAQAGNYHWVSVYSGNLPNTNGITHNAACTDTDEDVTVNTTPSSLFTAQSSVPNDSVTVSAPAGGNLNGKVTVTLYDNATCTGSILYGPVDVAVAVAQASPKAVSSANTTAVPATGSFSWRVAYDSNNAAQRDIPDSCQETSALSVTNGGTVSSP